MSWKPTGRRAPAAARRPRWSMHPAPLVTCIVLASCSADAGPVGPAGAQGPEGPQGPAGPGAPPSIGSITPLFLYREHADRVVITGSGTSWTSAAEIDLGAGVEVIQATVASPTAIVAQVRADSAAVLGPRDVSVTEGSTTATFEDVFDVQAPLALLLSRGSFVRGALIEGVLIQRNDEHLFYGPDDAPELVNTYVAERSAPGGSTLPTSPRRVPFTTYLALNEPGPFHFVAVSEGFQKSRTAALTPAELATVATPLGATTDFDAGPIETVIHRIDALEGQVLALSFSDPAPLGPAGAGPWLITPDSAFDMFSGRSRFYAPTQASWFVSVNVATSVDYTITVDTASVTPVALDSGPTTGSLSGPFGSDYYSLDVTSGETVTVSLADGPTDTCGPAGDIDAWIEVQDPIGRSAAGAATGCAMVQWGPATVAGTYAIEVRPAPSCAACPFDYEITATKN